MRYFEDFAPADQIALPPYEVTAQEIISFAKEFDPAPFHLDESAGKASMLGGLAASGWHGCAILMRMMCDAFVLDSASEGSPGVETCRWLAPILAGDTLTGTVTILEARVSRSRPQIGLVKCRYELFNQAGVTVLSMESMSMMRRRTTATEAAQ